MSGLNSPEFKGLGTIVLPVKGISGTGRFPRHPFASTRDVANRRCCSARIKAIDRIAGRLAR